MDNIKLLAKDAKKRLKSGFWEEHKDKIVQIKDKAKSEGIESSKIVKYYQTRVICNVKPKKDDAELFYTKVKSILDSVGEVSDIIGRLIDQDTYCALAYDAKQRYVMELSDKYRVALNRYKKENHL